MPEEINRVLTDQLADILFTPSADGDTNLKLEGIDAAKIRLVGNVMIDSLVRFLPLAQQAQLPTLPDSFVLVTLHRPSNVDDPARLAQLMKALDQIAAQIPVVFPIHPRTRQKLQALNWSAASHEAIQLWEPQGYLEFLQLQQRAKLVITDSGGIQEETTALGVPCITLRPNTERPVTISVGTNELFTAELTGLPQAVAHRLQHPKAGALPPLWDGKTGERIADVLLSL